MKKLNKKTKGWIYFWMVMTIGITGMFTLFEVPILQSYDIKISPLIILLTLSGVIVMEILFIGLGYLICWFVYWTHEPSDF